MHQPKAGEALREDFLIPGLLGEVHGLLCVLFHKWDLLVRDLPDGPRLIAEARSAWRWLRASRRVRREARDADVVVANGVLALPAVRLAHPRAAVVWFVHDVVERRDWRVLVRAACGCVDVAVAPSLAVAMSLERLGVTARVVPHGTPWPVEAAPADAPTPPVVGLVGALTPVKGQDLLLDVFAELDRPDAQLELVGRALPKDAGYERLLRERAERPDLAGRVRFVGHVDDVLARMRGWTVAVSSSTGPEAAGLSVLEAMSVGVPVVAAAHGGPVEFVDGAGLLIPPRDRGALTEAIRRIIDEPELRSEYGSAGRRAVAEHTLEHELDELTAILRERARRPRSQVTVVVPDYFPRRGGTTQQAAAIAEGLQQRGHAVTVLTRRREPELARREVVNGIPVRRVGSPSITPVVEKLGVLAVAWRLAVHRPDSVCVIMYPDFAVAAGLAGLSRRTLMCWAGTGDATDTIGVVEGPGRGMLRAVRRHFLARGSSFVLTPGMRAELNDLGFAVELVPLPLELDRMRPATLDERASARRKLGLADGDFVVVVVGQLRRLKAVNRLVDATRMLVEEGRLSTRLLVVGGPSDTDDRCDDELYEQVRAVGLDEHVTFVGEVDDVQPFLWAADASVLPSDREGMSFALVEAMAAGLPCIAPAYPVGADVLGDAGLVIPDNEPATIAAALARLADDPSLREQLGHAAREASRTWDAERVVDRYESVLAGRGAAT